MTAEDRILFLCARQDFLPAHRQAVEALCGEERGSLRWEALAATAEEHGVAPIAGYNLRSCDPAALDLPPAAARRLELAFFENAVTKEKEAERLAAALVHLRQAGYEAMLLKGTALDLLVYREPWVAASRDTDLVLRPLAGRELAPDERAVRRALYRSGIECDLLEHHDVTLNGALPVRFARIWEEARPVRFRGVEALVMSPEDLLISLCVNACRKRYFRLKSLFDLAESVRRLQGLDWDRLARRSREHGCAAVVWTALAAARETLDCPLPAGALDGLGVPAFRRRLLGALISRFLRASSLVSAGDGVSRLLPYAALRPRQAWRAFRWSVTHRPPPHHRAEAAERASFVGPEGEGGLPYTR
jgi:hypothetical protein